LKIKVYKTQNPACAAAQTVHIGLDSKKVSEEGSAVEKTRKNGPQVRYRTARTSLMRLLMKRLENQGEKPLYKFSTNVT